MANLYYRSDDTLAALPGSSLAATIAEAKHLSCTRREMSMHSLITFDFNGVSLQIDKDSDLALIERDWKRASAGCLGDNPVVGPRPKPQLSSEELAQDARLKATTLACYNNALAEAAAKTKEHHARVIAKMANAPAMAFVSSEAKALWESRMHAAVGGNAKIMAYAERWARMMQLEMAEGKLLADIWQTTQTEADLEGMSGTTTAASERRLMRVWVHGVELGRLRDEYNGS